MFFFAISNYLGLSLCKAADPSQEPFRTRSGKWNIPQNVGFRTKQKLDGVGPIDNRPSPDTGV